MPFDDLTLGEDQTPLEMPQPQGKGLGGIAPLLSLLAVAAKSGGRPAAAALLQGWQEARQQSQQQGRLSAQDARQGRLDQQNQDFRQQQLMLQANAQQQAEQVGRQRFMGQFTEGLGGLEDEEAVRAYLTLMQGQAPSGVNPADLETATLQMVKPSTLQKRQAEKRIASLKGQFGADWMQEASKYTHMLGSESVQFDELLRRAGMTPDPTAAQAPTSRIQSDVPLDRQHAAALASGDQGLATLIEQSMTRQDAARRDPADPVMGELRQMRLDREREAAKTGPQLPAATQRRVDTKTRAFDQQPVVKRIQTMAEGVQFADSLDINTTNPADDQGLIYAFAKAMDPDSVVREGEYATVQMYAQSWAQRFGFDIARIFSNTQFLTPQARANMKRTIRARYASARPQYDNLRRSYAQQISRITGQDDGETYLVDYAAGFPEVPNKYRNRSNAEGR